MGAACIALFLFGTDWMLAAALAVILSVAAYELVTSAVKSKSGLTAAIPMLAAFGMMAMVYLEAPALWYLLQAYVLVVLLFGVGLLSGGKITFTAVCVAVLAGVILPFMMAPLVMTFRMENGRALVFLLVIVPVASDTGALVCGKLWGKHRLAPAISPGKTREGVAGGVFGAILGVLLVGGIIQAATGLTVRYDLLAVLAVPCSVLAQVGDLAMSYAKREFGIKDFGSLIPGHGGALDRIDSWLFTVPLVYAVFLLWPPVI